MFNTLAESKLSKEELVKGGAIELWLEISIKMAESDSYKSSLDDRCLALKIFSEIWMFYP